MLSKLRLALALFFLFMVVAVDFASKMLSITADFTFVVLTVMVVWPILKNRK